MENKERRRSIGKVDRLPPELKDTVEQMLLTGSTYKEIVTFLKENGEEMSQMAICTYAKKYLATVEMINVAQSNFSMLMDEMNRYPDLDTSEALIRLSSHHVINALTNIDEEQMKDVPIEKLIKENPNGKIIEKKKKEIYEELERIKSILNIVLQFQDDPNSNDFIPYDPNNTDNEASNLVKVYNNILMIEESLITYLRDKGY